MALPRRRGAFDTGWRYAGDRPSRWADPTDVWFHGFWKYAWADCHVPAASIDLGTKTVTFGESPGYGIDAEQPYYAYNIPEELTVPGEYWIDRATGIALSLAARRLRCRRGRGLAARGARLFDLNDASYVELRDLTFEAGRAELVRVDGGSHDSLVGLTLRNAGTNAGSISGTRTAGPFLPCVRHGQRRIPVTRRRSAEPLTEAKNVGRELALSRAFALGVDLPSGHVASAGTATWRATTSSTICPTRRSSTAATSIRSSSTTSTTCASSRATRAPSTPAVTGDTAATSSGTTSSTTLSTWFEGYGVQGIYLDDCVSGIRVEGNVLYGISGHGIQHGGGRDNIMVNNIIARCGGALTADSRCMTGSRTASPNNTPGDSWNLLEKLQNVSATRTSRGRRAYPECAAIPNDWTAISRRPRTGSSPKGPS